MSSKLRDTRHYINRQVPATIRERNKYALPEFKLKWQNPANKAKLVGGKFYVKGQLQTEFLAPSLPQVDIMDVEAPKYPVTKGSVVQDAGSSFAGFAANIFNLDDVASVLDNALLMDGVATSTHRMYAYRYKDGDGTVYQNFDSDGDDGVGSELLKAMVNDNVLNTIWIATRSCKADYKHIGAKRFTHAISTCKEASGKL